MERSTAAKSAKSVFFEEFNDIDVYIEDTAAGYEKLFVELLSRVFNEKYRVSNVFPLGSKITVLDEHSRCKGNLKRPSLYIVDGDLNLINGETIRETGLYSLPFYCIENILIDEDSLYKILNEEDPATLKEEIIEKFDFIDWTEKNLNPLLDLFIDYGVSFKLTPTLPTVGFEVKHLISSNSGTVDPEKIKKRKSDLISEISQITSNESYQKARNELEKRIGTDTNSCLKYISAKDYLLPLLLMRMRKATNSRTPNLNIKIRLAMICNIEMITEISDYVALPANHEEQVAGAKTD